MGWYCTGNMNKLVCHDFPASSGAGDAQKCWRSGNAREDLCWATTDAKWGRASEGAAALGQGEGQWVLVWFRSPQAAELFISEAQQFWPVAGSHAGTSSARVKSCLDHVPACSLCREALREGKRTEGQGLCSLPPSLSLHMGQDTVLIHSLQSSCSWSSSA